MATPLPPMPSSTTNKAKAPEVAKIVADFRKNFPSGHKANNLLFWSGMGQLKAVALAQQEGRWILEMLLENKKLLPYEKWTKSVPWDEAKLMWARLSSAFAQFAEGKAKAIMSHAGRAKFDSMWNQYEKPTLVQRGIDI
ncbi:MAG: hypothetical protein GOMPHAMPRED_006727 [Gomphillus americanus]|uniref:Uncharacterized protein n=1 Tax=Gomphillus americanus TaxID=1940652 RepID=A0A8H3HZU0_9LECA|nr:MAG: hypothetical protein GOMPHAMPRED_006727 [Gomphillus americanus]